jgi:DNA-binding winged helix-turn-helix (wHTH) protein
MGGRPGSRIRIQDIEIVPGSRQVLRDGEDLALTGRTFDFLIALVEAAPDIASPDGLAKAVWDGRPVSPETINQRAKLLRAALGDDSHSPRYFTAVRGQGYRLLATPEEVKSEVESLGSFRPITSGLVLLGLAALLAGIFWITRPGDAEPSRPEAYAAASAWLDLHSAAGLQMAVEGFGQALAEDPDHVPSLAGLAEARLLQSRYRLLDQPVADRLAMDLIERARNQDPQSARVHAIEGLLWAQRGEFDRAEAAFRRALSLDARLATAHLHYGQLLLEHPFHHRPFEAVDLWRRGARINPDSALLQAHLAWTDLRAGRFDEAEHNLVRLIEASPQLVTAHFVLAELHLTRGRQVQAIEHYRRVLVLNRFFTPLAHDGLVRALIDLGLEDQVAEVLEELRAMPDDAGWWPSVFLVAMLETTPPDNESLQVLRSTGQELARQRPSDSAFALAMIELLEHNYPAARDLLEQGEQRLAGALGELPVDGYWRMLICPYAHVLIELGEVDRGQAIANWLLNRIETGPDLARFKHPDPVLCQTALGHIDQAMAMLEQAAADGLPSGWRFMRYRPDLVALQAHPDFEPLMTRLANQAEAMATEVAAP